MQPARRRRPSPPATRSTCSATYTVTQADLDAGSVTNTATASATDPDGDTVSSNEDTATVDATQNPALTIVKSASPTDLQLRSATSSTTAPGHQHRQRDPVGRSRERSTYKPRL